MARGKVNIGGGNIPTQEPTITYVSKDTESITFTVTNNDAVTAIVYYEHTDDTPDLASVELATGVTSSNITISGLTDETQYTIYCQAMANDQSKGWSTVASITQTTDAPPPPWFGDRGVFAGGYNGSSPENTIDYVSIPTPGNAVDFGDRTITGYQLAGCSDGSRGLFAGGDVTGSGSSQTNTIDYVTIATPGNAVDFGDMTTVRSGLTACSDGTYGVFLGGKTDGTNRINIIDYVTIQTLGNAVDFGDLLSVRTVQAGCGGVTRGLIGGGYSGSAEMNNIEYITIATPGNSIDFGDLVLARAGVTAISDLTRGIFTGGRVNTTYYNYIEYVTMDTQSNTTDFGDLTVGTSSLSGCASATRGLFAGGHTPTEVNTIEYITIQTPGNATDFGDLTVARRGSVACSGN